jgi:hypothetical protein
VRNFVQAAVAAVLALAPIPAFATTYFTDNFDTYTSNAAMPNGPWHGDQTLTTAPGNVATSTTQAVSAPNSVRCGAGGNPSNMYQSLGTTVTGMTITFSVWPTSYGTGGFGDPVASQCRVGGHIVASGTSVLPAAIVNLSTSFGQTLPPPSGKVYLTVVDCNNLAIGTFTINDSTWHTIVLSFSCTGTISDFVTLKIDGTTQTLSATAQVSRSYDQAVVAGASIGNVPPQYGFYDNFTVESPAVAGTDTGEVSLIQ